MNDFLHVSVAGDGPPLILMHGLFGLGSNLKGLARSLQDAFRTCLVDLPDHGRSAWLPRTGIEEMAAVLRAWVLEQGLERPVLAGHSLGGKVAMRYALDHPGEVAAVVAADIEPVAYPPSHAGVFSALKAVAEAGCGSREEAAGIMARYLEEDMVIQFLLMSCTRRDAGEYGFRFNLAGLREGYDRLLAGLESDNPYPGPALFVRGGASDYVARGLTGHTRRLFPAAGVETLEGCGHWLHAEQPARFNDVVGGFLRRWVPG